MIRIYKDIKLLDGTIVNIHVHSREGLKSPDSWYYEYNGRLISPFERRVKNWSQPNLNFFFKRIYGHLLEDLLSHVPLLTKIPKDDNWKGSKWIKPL